MDLFWAAELVDLECIVCEAGIWPGLNCSLLQDTMHTTVHTSGQFRAAMHVFESGEVEMTEEIAIDTRRTDYTELILHFW